MDKKDIKELIHKIEHEIISDFSSYVWEMEETMRFANTLAHINGVADFANRLIEELDKTESDCDENN